MNNDNKNPSVTGDLFKKNLLALRKHIRPGLLDRLENEPPLNVQAIRQSDGRHNMTVEGNPIYVPDAETYANEQVETYVRTPMDLRYSLESMNAFSRSGETENEEISVSIIKKLYASLESSLPTQPLGDIQAGYCLCLGLGLGFHLQKLVNGLNFRDLIIYDPCLDTLRCSMHVIDWAPVVERIEGQGGRIKFLFELDHNLASKAIMAFMREENFGLIEGSYIFRHYPLPAIQKTLKNLSSLKSDLIIYNGWLEDEMIHFRNGMRNFLYRDLKLLNEPLPLQNQCPAFIVGSGPSLTQDIETIRKMSERAVIISCGSSIRILLSHGIKPDFHCELENVFFTIPVIAEVASKFDLSGITLIASTTVQPAVFDFFDDHIVFFREGGGAVRWLQQDKQQLSHASPSCTNVGARVAIQMGFQSLYLFGIDLGSTDPSRHHAEGSIYTSVESATAADRVEEMHLAFEKYPLQCPGNFRDQVHTSPLMEFQKNSMELLALTRPDITIRNCSDGALIQGALPTHSKEITIPPTTNGSQIKEDILSNLEEYQRGSFVDPGYIRALEQSLENWNQRYRDICGDESIKDFLAFHDRIRDLCDSTLPKEGIDPFDRATRILMSGSLLKIMHFIRFVDCRLLAEARPSYFQKARSILLQAAPEFEKRQLEIVRQIRRRVERGSSRESDDLDLFTTEDLEALCLELSFSRDEGMLDSVLEQALNLNSIPKGLCDALHHSYLHQGREEHLIRICKKANPSQKDNASAILAYKP